MPAFRIQPYALLAAAALTLVMFTACITSSEKNSGNAGSALPDTVAANVSWTSTAQEYRGQNDRKVTYVCPANGYALTIWGTDIYTDDSSVCTAAVHAGKISFATGGTVIIQIRPGNSAYVSSVRNGVTSSDWGEWDGSFIFP